MFYFPHSSLFWVFKLIIPTRLLRLSHMKQNEDKVKTWNSGLWLLENRRKKWILFVCFPGTLRVSRNTWLRGPYPNETLPQNPPRPAFPSPSLAQRMPTHPTPFIRFCGFNLPVLRTGEHFLLPGRRGNGLCVVMDSVHPLTAPTKLPVQWSALLCNCFFLTFYSTFATKL